MLEQSLDQESRALYDEAIVCYQVDAHRAALLLSYIGFMKTVASRLMRAQRPTKIPESAWSALQGGIRSDQEWETQAYNALVRTQPDSIFLADDDLRQQIAYWRGRRNDAAHSRGNELSASHVEAFWLFLRSNLPKLIVNGGREGLLERFRRHFDPSKTPPGQPFSHLVADIPAAMRPTEYRSFLKSVLDLSGAFHGIDDVRKNFDIESEGLAFIDAIVHLNDHTLIEALTDDLHSQPSLLVACLLARPQLVSWFCEDPAFVRTLWHELLPLEASVTHSPIEASLRVLIVMLRTGLIPQDQQVDAVDRVVARLKECYPYNSIADEIITDLSPYGLFDAVGRHAFVNYGHEEWAALNIGLTFDYVCRFPITFEIAATFCGVFPGKDPKELPYNTRLQVPELVLDLRMSFQKHCPEKYADLVRVARENNLPVDLLEHALGDPRSTEENK